MVAIAVVAIIAVIVAGNQHTCVPPRSPSFILAAHPVLAIKTAGLILFSHNLPVGKIFKVHFGLKLYTGYPYQKKYLED